MLGHYGFRARQMLIAGVLSGMAASGGACGWGWEEESCPVSECTIDGPPSCRGNLRVECIEVESFIHDHGVLCSTGYLETWDCAQNSNAECVDGVCVLRDERCPPGALGLCRDGTAHRCFGERLEATGNRCSIWEGVECISVTSGGLTDAACSLPSPPCASTAWGWRECRGDVAVGCLDGYPLAEEACAHDEPCVEGFCQDLDP